MSILDSPAGAWVYLMEGGGLIKIGRADDPEVRHRQIQAMSPVPITLLASAPGDYAEEGALHRRFAGARRHGEWFGLDDDQRHAALSYVALLNALHADWWDEVLREVIAALCAADPADIADQVPLERIEAALAVISAASSG